MFSENLTDLDGDLNDKKWINISECRDELRLGKKVSFPVNLIIRKKPNSPYFYALWMPELEDDFRKTTKKRRPYEKSTGTTNPREAALTAITWVKEKQRECVEKLDEIEEIHSKSLSNYWNIHFDSFAISRSGRTSITKLLRDEKLKWTSEKYGLEKEHFSKIRVDQISRKHLEDYFSTLSGGMKAQQKTLINKLFKLSEADFVGHSFPSFPTISKQHTKQPVHFQFEQWEQFMGYLDQKTEGKARSEMTFEHYKNLEFNKFNRVNQRNLVDLFDALWVTYYWFLRSQDLQKLRIEWFSEDPKNREFVLRIPDPKSDRREIETRNIKDGAYDFFKRLLKRRASSGWLIMPFVKRESEGGAENKVSRDLNKIFKVICRECLPDFPKSEVKITNVRHTTFRHHLEDDMTFGQYPKIVDFARNGCTSPEMLQETYINYISRETSLRESKSKMRPSNFSLIKKAVL
tara:strand:- start:20 stop:1405 length:1386 start_codon:yes stop_codon:yes gene_type:complete